MMHGQKNIKLLFNGLNDCYPQHYCTNTFMSSRLFFTFSFNMKRKKVIIFMEHITAKKFREFEHRIFVIRRQVDIIINQVLCDSLFSH